MHEVEAFLNARENDDQWDLAHYQILIINILQVLLNIRDRFILEDWELIAKTVN